MRKVFKKAISVLLVAVMVFGAAPLAGFVGLELPEINLFSSKAEAATEGYYTYTVSNGEATITDCNTSISGDITIPSTLGGYPVTRIDDFAFEYCGRITSITIPDSVISIDLGAFDDLMNLTSVTIGKSVTRIDQYAFRSCTSLTSIIIPDSVISIGSYAFYNCDNLTSVAIGDSVTSIGSNAFEGCDSLTSIIIPDSVITIGFYAFQNCASLTSVTIGNGVTSIGQSAFEYCFSLTNVTIGDSVTSIGSYVFGSCASLISVIIPNTVTSIGSYAFYNCDNLTSVAIGDSVTSIGGYAFYGCDSLTNISIGDSVTSIGSHAFEYCDNLASITIPNSVISIGDYVFRGCTSFTSVTIGNGVTSIGSYAFGGCDIKTIYYGGSEEEWKKLSNRPSSDNIYYNCHTGSDKLTLSKDFYTCFEGESVFVSGDMYAAYGISNVTLHWSSGDGVEVLTPASIINSDANNASFSVEVKGLSAGMHSVTVYTTSGKSDSCIIKVIKPESELAVSVGGAGEYYFVDGKLLDGELNEVDEISFKVTVENRLKDGNVSELTEELKEKLMIKDVKVSSSLSDYSGLLIDIEDMNELQNIGDLQVGEKKEFTLNVYPNNFKLPENEITLDTVASASEQSDISIITPIEIKDKLYDPQAVVSLNVFNQNITYKDKKYDSESIEVSVRVTNRIPSSFSGNAAKLREFSGYDITVSEVEISAEDSKLLSDAGIRTKELNTVLRAGESTVIKETYHINSKHKMDEKVESETVGFSCNVSTSANSPSASKSVTFINENYKNDTSISYEKTSVRNLFEEMRSELRKCDALNGTEKSLVDYIITSHIMAMDLSDLKNILDATEKVYDLSSLISKLDKSYYEIAGEYVLDAILEEADKTEDGLKAIIEECLEALRDSEEFNTFIKWYYDQQNTKKNSNKRTDVRCPVDVYAYDESGKEVLSIIGNVIVKAEGDIHAFVCEDDKIIYLPTDTDYDIKIIATGNGTMDYIVTEYSSESELRKTVYEDIPLVVDEQYTGVVTKSTLPDADTYNLISSDGTEFAYTDVKYVDPDIDAQVEIPTPSTTTINYGDKIILHANIESELPVGYEIKWISSNNNFSMSVSADGKTCTISPASSGDTVFTAVVVDENENTVSSDEQTMTAKAGFFQKIIAFFKKLFGLTKTIPQLKMF